MTSRINSRGFRGSGQTSRTGVAVAAAVVAVVTVALLLGGVKPVPHVSCHAYRLTSADTKSIQLPNIEGYVGVSGVVISQPQEGVLHGYPGAFELAAFPTSTSGGDNEDDGNVVGVGVPRKRRGEGRDVPSHVEYVAAITVLSTAFEANNSSNGMSQGD